MALTSHENPSLVIDVLMPQQENSWGSTEFTERGLADFFDAMVDQGLHPANFGRIWCHTHPGKSATPSGVDEATFTREFAGPNWAIMFIVGTEGDTTCRLKYRITSDDLIPVLGTHRQCEIPTIIDWTRNLRPWDDKICQEWEDEYKFACKEKIFVAKNNFTGFGDNEKELRVVANNKVYFVRFARTGTGIWVREEEKNLARWFMDWKDFKKKHNINTSTSGKEADTELDLDCMSEEQWKEALDGAKKHRGGTPSKASSPLVKLNRREKKFLQKNGSLAGYVPPKNSGVKTSTVLTAPDREGKPVMVSLSKLENKPQITRNLLLEDAEEEDGEWVPVTKQNDDGFLEDHEYNLLIDREIKLNHDIDSLIFSDKDLTPFQEGQLARWEDELADVEKQLKEQDELHDLQEELDAEEAKLAEELAADVVISTQHLTAPAAENPNVLSMTDSIYDCMN